MSEPRFLTLEQVCKLHQKSIERFGGTQGVRSADLLEAAVIHPQNVRHYAQGDLFDVAAAYCYHIAQAQAFIDGNKRTAVAAGSILLAYGSYDRAAPEEEMGRHKGRLGPAPEGRMDISRPRKPPDPP